MASMTKETINIEHDLIDASIQLGNIAECPWHYTAGLAVQIAASGKKLNEMTIGELLRMHQDRTRQISELSQRIADSRFNLCEFTPSILGDQNA